MSLLHTIKTLPALSGKDRLALAYTMIDYFPRIGQHQPIKPISTLSPAPITNRKMPAQLSLTEQRLWHLCQDDHAYRARILGQMPHFLVKYFGKKYEHLFITQGRRTANTFLRETLDGNHGQRIAQVQTRYQKTTTPPSLLQIHFHQELTQIAEYDQHRILRLANEIALCLERWLFARLNDNAFKINAKKQDNVHIDGLELALYRQFYGMIEPLGIAPPFSRQYQQKTLTNHNATVAFAKITEAKWWQRQLKKRRNTQREHLAIAAGQVQAKAHAYCSLDCYQEWLNQKKSNLEFLKRHDIFDEATGTQLPLFDQVIKSNANPAIRRCELMVRIRGFEDLAEQLDYVGEFYTFTAPSKYHSAHRAGGFVTNWAGFSPKETQDYLCKMWAKIRAKLKREHIQIFGFRVAEPHHDGTPHWHMLLFMSRDHVQSVRDIFSHYALEEDGTEMGAQTHRFKYEAIDKKRGSATGYIAKYISKNIDGYALENQTDDETGENLQTMAKSVSAWASRWRIRQFQQIGGPPVSVWRELRRLRDQQVAHPDIDAALAAADIGDWAAYTQAQGGPVVQRKNLKVRAHYTHTVNQYAEEIKKIDGVYSTAQGADYFICTRKTKWAIIKKNNVPFPKAHFSSPWSSVNNCTPQKSQIGKMSNLQFMNKNESRFLKIDLCKTKIRCIFNTLHIKRE